MPIIATAGDSKNYTPAPEGTHQAICVDVIDLGLHPNTFRPGTFQPKINVVWQIDEVRDDGKRHQVYKRYTLSLNEKANLRHDLESWRGKAFTRDEELGFDVEKLIGANCLVNVQHVTKDAKTYANVKSVMPLIKGMVKIVALDYKRPEPEPDAKVLPAPSPDVMDAEREPDDDIPF